MNRNGLALLAAAILLIVAGSFFQEDPRRLGATSHGTRSQGHHALLEVLERIAGPVEQSYELPAFAAPDRPLWFIEPWSLCDPEVPEVTRELAPFLERGGTAVVLLAARRRLLAPGPDRCDELAGFALPERVGGDLPTARVSDDAEDDAADDEEAPEWGRTFASTTPEAQQIETRFGADRTLDLPRLATFVDVAEDGPWSVLGTSDGEPFILEARPSEGDGRLVVVADGSFLSNRWIDGGDAILLATDLAAAFGLPRIDEAQHGLRNDDSALLVIGQLGAVPIFLGIAVGWGLWIAWRRTLPAAHPDAVPGVLPAAEPYVASLVALYANSRDHASLAEHYRRSALGRIRRHFGLGPEASAERLVERLAAEGRLPREDARRLAQPAMIADRDAWLREARALDRIVGEGCR